MFLDDSRTRVINEANGQVLHILENHYSTSGTDRHVSMILLFEDVAVLRTTPGTLSRGMRVRREFYRPGKLVHAKNKRY